jgi:hypothetical protein
MSRKGIIRTARVLTLVLVPGFIATAAFSQSSPARSRDDLDVTMHVIVDPDAKVPDEIVRRIQLPKPGQAAPAEDKKSTDEKKAEPGAKGQERSSESREQGREFGQQVSEEAKQRAEEVKRNQGKKPDKPHPPPPSPPGRPSTPPGG